MKQIEINRPALLHQLETELNSGREFRREHKEELEQFLLTISKNRKEDFYVLDSFAFNEVAEIKDFRYLVSHIRTYREEILEQMYEYVESQELSKREELNLISKIRNRVEILSF